MSRVGLSQISLEMEGGAVGAVTHQKMEGLQPEEYLDVENIRDLIMQEVSRHRSLKISNCHIFKLFWRSMCKKTYLEREKAQLRKEMDILETIKTNRRLKTLLDAHTMTSLAQDFIDHGVDSLLVKVDNAEIKEDFALPSFVDPLTFEVIRKALPNYNVFKSGPEQEPNSKVNYTKFKAWLERQEKNRLQWLKQSGFQAILSHSRSQPISSPSKNEDYRKRQMNYFSRSRSPSKVPDTNENQ